MLCNRASPGCVDADTTFTSTADLTDTYSWWIFAVLTFVLVFVALCLKRSVAEKGARLTGEWDGLADGPPHDLHPPFAETGFRSTSTGSSRRTFSPASVFASLDAAAMAPTTLRKRCRCPWCR